MKKSHYTLMAAWLLLFCFIAGQVIVYSHQHHTLKYAAEHKQEPARTHHQSFAEKCKLCDVMHHTDMVLQQDQQIVSLQPVLFIHPQVTFNFKSFGLILSDGLSPPCFIIS